jgi:plastocyanin
VRRAVLPAVLVALALAPAPPAGAGATRTVRIGDNFFTPATMSVTSGTTVRWRWPTTTGDTHDVKLDRGPKGVRKFHSEAAASDFSFRRTLTVPGTYRIVCTFHEEMTQTIRVRR